MLNGNANLIKVNEKYFLSTRLTQKKSVEVEPKQNYENINEC